jgi:hypothetical protein
MPIKRARLERLIGSHDVARLVIDHCAHDLSERNLRLLGEDLLRVLATLTREQKQREAAHP